MWFVHIEASFSGYVVEDLKRSEYLSFGDAAPFKQFNVLIKHSSGMRSRRYSAGLYETLNNISNALGNGRRGESYIPRGVAGTSALEKGKCVEGSGRYFVRGGVCVSLQQLA